MSNPFIINSAPATPEQIKAAKLELEQTQLIRDGSQLLQQSISTVQRQWDSVWNNPVFTPAEKLAQMGINAVAIFDTAAIFTAAIYSIDSSLLDPKYLSAALPYVRHEDGTITLA